MRASNKQPVLIVAICALVATQSAVRAEETATGPKVVENTIQVTQEQEVREAKAKISQARKHKDWQAAINVYEDWAAKYPLDFNFQRTLPVLYTEADDAAGWDQARLDLMLRWAEVKKTAQAQDNSFLIEWFKVGRNVVVVQQCYERNGPDGISYKFDVSTGTSSKVRSVFTVSSPVEENKAARAAGLKTPVIMLNHFESGKYDLVAKYSGAQSYQDLRGRVKEALEHAPAPSSARVVGTAEIIGCETAASVPPSTQTSVEAPAPKPAQTPVQAFVQTPEQAPVQKPVQAPAETSGKK